MTKAERHKAYKQALEFVQTRGLMVSGLGVGVELCYAINTATEWYVMGYHTMRTLFPELAAQKPKRSKHGAYWWSPGNKAPRVRALKAAITLSAPKKRTTKKR